jgi:ABC-2 type transport system ATP-binding protein
MGFDLVLQRVLMNGSFTLSDQQLMIEADGLCKYYGRFAATQDVSFQVKKGEVVAFLGPNGAGKSTTMKLLTGYLAPSAGVARICGQRMDVDHERLVAASRLGYLPENGPLYDHMSPLSMLKFFAAARGMKGKQLRDRLDYVIDLCQLGTVLSKPTGKLSRGYRQRVGMAQALLHDPDVLIMDEPTAGLDPNQIVEVRHAIRKLGETKTILLSTHILQEVKEMCNRVILVNEGKVKFDGTVDELASGRSLDDRFHELTAATAAV